MTVQDTYAQARPSADGPAAESHYAVALRRGTAAEQRIVGGSEDEVRARYADLWPAGWRLRQLRGAGGPDGPRYTATWKRSLRSEISVYGVPLEELLHRYEWVGEQGWRLKFVNAHTVEGPGVPIGYTAAWEPSLTPERQAYGVSVDEFTTRYQDLATQGWRLKSLAVHQATDVTEPRYTALWQPSVAPEIVAHDLSEVVYQARYERLWIEGWRLKFLAPYVSHGRRRITAVWTRSTSPEIQMPATTAAELDTRYAALWGQGWRLKMIEPY